MPIKVLLADDSEIARQAIRRLLASEPGIELVGEADGFARTIQMTTDLDPHVIVVDLGVVKKTKVHPVKVKSFLTGRASRLLAISVWKNEEAEELATALGLFTLLDKMNLAGELIPAIMRVASHDEPGATASQS